MAKLGKERLRYVEGQCGRSRPARAVAAELGVTTRRIRQLYAEFRRTGAIRPPMRPGRKARPATAAETQLVLRMHGKRPAGVLHTARILREHGHNISSRRVYRADPKTDKPVTF